MFNDLPVKKGMDSCASFRPSFEVFLSFRGGDTRHGFTDCLYHGMVAAGILVFKDDESLRVGKRIGDELLQAIKKSKIHIPIFSKNYASSHWCLRELAYMVECTSKATENKEILPIFLDVEPDDVKLKTDLYSQALSKHQEKFFTEVESWKKALIEVDEIKGWNWKRDESQGDLIRSIIRTVLVKLNIRIKNVTEHLVGVDDHVEVIVRMLDLNSDGVKFLGIHGMGGVGKTTLAKVVFNRLSSSFGGCNFIADVRESTQRNGLVYLQKQLLSEFLTSKLIKTIHDIDSGVNMIKRTLSDEKVLIVLDDVDEKDQLKSLAEKGNWFGSGSRIIITTRNKSVLMIDGEAKGEGCTRQSANVLSYEVREMEFDHALELFSRHAFRSDSPPDHYVSLSEQVVSILGKLPLALEVIGSFLSGKSEALWVDTWKKLQKTPPMEVQKTLRISYERLDDAQKQVFLDIACFFVDKDKTYPFYMWDDCGYYPQEAIEVLFLLSLIKINDNSFWMHDQVRDLGREIVHQENFKDPCKRSRVWNHEETLSILKRKEGSKKIEALSLGYSAFCEGILTRDEFANLPNLRFFQGDFVSFTGDFSNLLSNLRWLSWRCYSEEFMATNFHPTNLIVLNFSCYNILEDWHGWNQIKAASKLKVLDLSGCCMLRRTPDLSMLTSLEKLILICCSDLIEIHPSIGELKLLTTLDLSGCESLQEFPEEIGYLEALTEIILPDTLHELPEIFYNLRSLLNFDVPNRQIRKLPYSIGGLVKIRRLDLSQCANIKELPESVGKLQSLVELDLSSTNLVQLPDSIGKLKQLKVLRMSHIMGMTKLPSAIGLLEKLEELDAQGCVNLTGGIPEEIEGLSCLRILNLSYTCISTLPTTVSRLSNLQKLILESCPELKQLPDLPPSLICLEWDTDSDTLSYKDLPYELESFSALPTGISTLSQLETLRLSCRHVQFLPQLPPCLRKLELRHLATTRLPDFSNLESLSILRFHCCSISESSGIYVEELEALRLEKCMFRKLDTLYRLQMENWKHLEMSRFLPEILDLTPMKNLQEVDLFGCKLLVEICGLEELQSLCFLSVADCSSIKRMSCLSGLKKLRELRIGECPKLISVEGLSHLKSLKNLYIWDCRSLESLASTSHLELERSVIMGCERLPNCDNYF